VAIHRDLNDQIGAARQRSQVRRRRPRCRRHGSAARFMLSRDLVVPGPDAHPLRRWGAHRPAGGLAPDRCRRPGGAERGSHAYECHALDTGYGRRLRGCCHVVDICPTLAWSAHPGCRGPPHRMAPGSFLGGTRVQREFRNQPPCLGRQVFGAGVVKLLRDIAQRTDRTVGMAPVPDRPCLQDACLRTVPE